MAQKKEKKELQQAPAQKNIAEAVLARVNNLEKTGGLVIPEDYIPGNALNAAYLKLQEVKDKQGRPATAVCTPASATTALLDMVIQGLSPARDQCYFVVYGNQLTLMRSYQGTVLAAKRFGNVKDVFAQVVFEGDRFEYDIDPATGVPHVTVHSQSIANRDGQIVAAYATVIRKDGATYTEIMTWKEIQAAWNMGSGQSKAHKQFPQEMAKKTVINRACKGFVKTTSDQDILAGAFNRTTENEYIKDDDFIVEDADAAAMNDMINNAVFGSRVEEPAEEPAPAEPVQEETFAPTPEEIAAIEAREIAEAEAEAERYEVEYEVGAQDAE